MTACVFIGIILCLVLSKQNKDISTLLSICICCLVATVALTFIQPVIDFLDKMQELTGVDKNLFLILTKCVGISLVGEIAGLICADAGYSAMGKVLQVLTCFAVLWISLPLFTKLIDLIESIMNC